MKGSLVWVLLGLLPVPAAAADLTLRTAVERALDKFPSVAAARAQQREAQEGLAAEKGARGPRGALNGWATQYQKPTLVSPIHSFKPSEIPDFDRTILQGQFSASYILWDGGATGARVAVAGSQVGGAEAALGAAEQDLAERVAAAYLTALGKARTLAAHDQRLAALEAELARARKLLDAGKA
ncbi:MAG TPA: TolC family protein, partial [Thermoanaerobaculia bacterium]